MKAHALPVLSLAALVLVSGVGVVYAKYESRALFVQLEKLRDRKDRAEMEWGRLQLEIATLGDLGLINEVAASKLDMHVPLPAEIVVVD